MHGERRGEPLRLHQDVSATRLPGGLETTLQVTSKKIKKRHYEHHMIEAHKYLITWISDDIFFKIVGSAVIILGDSVQCTVEQSFFKEV